MSEPTASLFVERICSVWIGIDRWRVETARQNGRVVAFGAALAAIGTELFALETILGSV